LIISNFLEIISNVLEIKSNILDKEYASDYKFIDFTTNRLIKPLKNSYFEHKSEHLNSS